jgi:hypothetical protein
MREILYSEISRKVEKDKKCLVLEVMIYDLELAGIGQIDNLLKYDIQDFDILKYLKLKFTQSTDLIETLNLISCLVNLETLDVSNNLFKATNNIHTHQKIALNFPFLKKLNFSNCCIKDQFKMLDFSCLINLEKLDLSKNQISTILNDTFVILSKLQTLDLRNNYVEKLEPNAFSSLINLHSLHIRLTTMENAYVLNYLKSLKFLEIDTNECQLEDLDSNILKYIPNVERLKWFTCHLPLNCIKEVKGLIELKTETFNQTNIRSMFDDHKRISKKIIYKLNFDLKPNQLNE